MKTSGAPVRVELTKWGDRPHYRFDALWLGEDRHGEWLGCPALTTYTRPGATYVGSVSVVTLIPAEPLRTGGDFLATMWAPGGRVDTYVDVTGPPIWDGDVLRCCDLDLDVVRNPDGHVWIADEDEFEQHRAEFGYTDEAVARAWVACEEQYAALLGGHAPYDSTPSVWHRQLAALVE